MPPEISQYIQAALGGRKPAKQSAPQALGDIQAYIEKAVGGPVSNYPRDAHDHSSSSFTGGVLNPGMSWKGTHVTDGLDWNNGQKTAVDILAPAGTPVAAPEAGRVVRWGSAQGGEAMYFKGKSGRMYWLGHIDDRLPVGKRVKAGGILARISSHHETPHLHIDYKL